MSQVQERVVTLPPVPALAGASAGEPVRAVARNRHGHIAALDGLRGIAVLMVILYHFSVLPIGWAGVSLFFVLSGFLITGILLDAKDAPHFFRNFYARRMLRIFPLYYGVLTVLFVVLPIILWLGDLDAKARAVLGEQYANYLVVQSNQIWLWCYGMNIARLCGIADWYGTAHFWSLAVEEHFYLLWPAVVFLVRRRVLAWVCVGAIIASTALRFGMYFSGVHAWTIYVFTLCRLDELALGSLLALAVRGGAWSALGRHAATLALVSAALLLGAIWHLGADMLNPWIATAGYAVLAVCSGAVLVLALQASSASWLRRVLCWWPLVRMGKYSYGAYVLQPFVTNPLRPFFDSETAVTLFGSAALSQVAFVLTGFVATIVAALLSWYLYEMHFLRLKKYFP